MEKPPQKMHERKRVFEIIYYTTMAFYRCISLSFIMDSVEYVGKLLMSCGGGKGLVLMCALMKTLL